MTTILAHTVNSGSRTDQAQPKLRAAKNLTVRICSSITGLYVAAALVGPLLVPFDAIATDTGNRLLPPLARRDDGSLALLGTDQVGQDLFAQVLAGARTSLLVAAVTLVLSCAIGVAIGLLAGWHGRWVDAVLMRLADITLTFPGILLAILIAAVLGPSLTNVVVVLSVTGWVTFARVTRASVLATKNLDYVDATRTLGASTWHVLRHCIIPACAAPVMVIVTLNIGDVILAEAALSFLGLGSPPSAASWGGTIATGRSLLGSAWWISTLPGLALAVLMVALGVLGDAARDRLDPNMKGIVR
jgi:peptide/nickel transport system permease protein